MELIASFGQGSTRNGEIKCETIFSGKCRRGTLRGEKGAGRSGMSSSNTAGSPTTGPMAVSRACLPGLLDGMVKMGLRMQPCAGFLAGARVGSAPRLLAGPGYHSTKTVDCCRSSELSMHKMHPRARDSTGPPQAKRTIPVSCQCESLHQSPGPRLVPGSVRGCVLTGPTLVWMMQISETRLRFQSFVPRPRGVQRSPRTCGPETPTTHPHIHT